MSDQANGPIFFAIMLVFFAIMLGQLRANVAQEDEDEDVDE